MVWLKVSDRDPRHMRALSDPAHRMILNLTQAVNRELCGDFVPTGDLDDVAPGKSHQWRSRALAELEKAGAIVAEGDRWRLVRGNGWPIDDQPTSEEVLASRSAEAERKRLERAAKSGSRPDLRPNTVRADVQTDVAADGRRTSARPVPSRPAPDPERKELLQRRVDELIATHYVAVQRARDVATLPEEEWRALLERLASHEHLDTAVHVLERIATAGHGARNVRSWALSIAAQHAAALRAEEARPERRVVDDPLPDKREPATAEELQAQYELGSTGGAT